MPAGASGVCDAPCQERPGLGPDCGGGTLGSLDEERFGFSVGQGSVSCIRPAGGGTLGSLNEEQFGFSVGQCPASGQRATGRRVRCC